MNISKTTQDNAIIINVAGRLDATTADSFTTACQEVLDQAPQKIIVQLGELEYISSAGLRGILILLKNCRAKSISIGFCSLQKMVEEVFKISGFLTMLSVFDNQDDALSNL